MVFIRRTDSKYREWKKQHDKKLLRNRINKTNISSISFQQKKQINSRKKPDKTFTIPEVFSIIDNPEETIAFFNNIIEKIEKIRNNKSYHFIEKHPRLFFLDMKNTKKITCDALMYLLSIIKNTRGKRMLPINWLGNFPTNDEMKSFLKNSGYLKYMNTPDSNIMHSTHHIQIKNGYGYEYNLNGSTNDIRAEIIDFTADKLHKSKTEINFLMTMLTEMITNIKDHAYDTLNTGLFEHNWYIFVEDTEDKIKYTFMDNGLGIPTTIQKKRFEEFLQVFNIDKEYKYIRAAVSGLEKRSKTGLPERGNGLPSIYEQYKEKKIANLVIISNKAYFCDNSKDLEYNLNGTVFYWEVNKEDKAYDTN